MVSFFTEKVDKNVTFCSIFSPISGIGSCRFLYHGGYHANVNALPFPCYSFQVIVLCKTFFPELLKKSFCRSSLKIAMNAAGTAVFPGERLPLNSPPQDINYGFKNLSGIHWFSASSFPAPICFGFITFHFRNEWFYFFPKLVGHGP